MPSRDEIIEWACGLADKYGSHPLRPIGMLDTYAFNGTYEKAMMKIEKQMEDEANGK